MNEHAEIERIKKDIEVKLKFHSDMVERYKIVIENLHNSIGLLPTVEEDHKGLSEEIKRFFYSTGKPATMEQIINYLLKLNYPFHPHKTPKQTITVSLIKNNIFTVIDKNEPKKYGLAEWDDTQASAP